jgi:Ig-like domain from next to BRCA1 gene/3-keto-disaccharide hydrolase
MNRQTLLNISILMLFAIIATACNMPSNQMTTPSPEPSSTTGAVTEQVISTKTQPVLLPTASPTQVPPSSTATSKPTATSTTTPTATSQTTPTSVSCTDLAKFVDDVTVPDDTEMLPGQEFIKTWRLQNVGTCTWTNQYSIIFTNGDQMNGTSPLPLTGSTPPNGTLDVSVNLKAPGTTGSYRGDWKFKNASGTIFGLGPTTADTFYVKIKVVEGVSELNLGAATWTDNLDNSNNWYLLDTENTKWTEGDGKLVLTSINPAKGEEWGLSDQPAMNDYYLQTTFITGGTCSGYDKYGLLARAPEENKGYVYEFSCDGHYRIYTWDGQNYNALQEWTSSDSIKAGSNQTNVMGIYMKGNDIRLYANDKKIAEFTDSTFDQGQFGLVIGSVNTHNFTVYVDQVAYWELK